jgi:hypothetical protein
MVANVSQIASLVLVRSLPWTQHKRWIPIRLMGCVCTHRRMHAIEGWGSPSCIRSVMQKTKEDNWKAGKTNQIISQNLPLGQNMIKFKHDGPQISHRRTCWIRYDDVDASKWNFEVEPFFVQWVVQMEEDTHELGVVEDHMPPWSVVRKKICCFQLMLRLQKKRDVDQPWT